MKITFRATDRIALGLVEQIQEEFDIPASDPLHFTPLELHYKHYRVDKGLQDMMSLFRGDTIPLDVTLLDYRGNPHPALATALSIQLAVSQLVPIRQQLFVISGTLVDALTGRVNFTLSPTETDQVDVDEAIGNVRLEVAAGEYKTFEAFHVAFKDSAFSLPT